MKYKILLGTFLWHTLYLKTWVRGADEIKNIKKTLKIEESPVLKQTVFMPMWAAFVLY